MRQQKSRDSAKMVEFLATVSHEFRGPLASIRGYANTLLRHEERLSHEERTEFLQAIVQGSDRLERIISRVLTLAQLEEKSLPLPLTRVDLALLLQEIVKTRQQDGQPFFSLELEAVQAGPSGTGYEVQANRRYLCDVFHELIDNAQQALPNGGTISLHLSFVASNQTMIKVQVQDQGIGIASEHLSAIFHAFYRIDTSLTRSSDGLGIGLALCASLMELHGGTIQVVSVPKEGSTFSVLLPASMHSGEE